MNKQALAEWVHGKLGGTKVQAEEIVDGLFDAIIGTMKKGGEVSIAGFGIFSVKLALPEWLAIQRLESKSKWLPRKFQNSELQKV